ncbi:LuxR C-terminal-related transcriptional regulator [Zoogloea sp.]|uniref:helix-turn-helix transcriptional regulator n=1 Tax=Zoogloea sp. TaxID=49181 RepID=UPI0025DEEFE3|nr:LuxR C-terminal-related transcriptional regulator [Zoogloea sp.]MCK6394549.1 LuxR C-terminal-related transcriptional regulator [Zoogloea sp.]
MTAPTESHKPCPISEAALEAATHGRWEAVLSELLHHTGAHEAWLLARNGNAGRLIHLATAGVEPAHQRDYVVSGQFIDPTFEWVLSAPDQCFMRADLRTDPPFVSAQGPLADHAHFRARRHIFATLLCREYEIHTFLILYWSDTPPRLPQVGAADADLKRQLSACAAASTLRYLADALSVSSQQSNWSDESPTPVLICTRTAQIIFANRAGCHMLKNGNIVTTRNEQLWTSDFRSRKAIETAIQACTGDPMIICIKGRGRGHVPLIIQPSHKAGYASGFQSISFPTEQPVPSELRLKQALSLTDTEAKLIHVLLDDNDVPKAAAKLGIKPDSVRMILKRAYGKFGVSSKVELLMRARLIPGVPPLMNRGDCTLCGRHRLIDRCF